MPVPTSSASMTVSTKNDDGQAGECCFAASVNSPEVADNEHLATFGDIRFSQSDLIYNEGTGFLQGDFFYILRETIPADATAVTAESSTPSARRCSRFFTTAQRLSQAICPRR